nr:MAG TPA: hypothetical protein [Caudoviricetes sp.]
MRTTNKIPTFAISKNKKWGQHFKLCTTLCLHH